MFHVIPDAFAITRSNGLFRQVPVYHHNGRIFVKHGAGYAHIHSNGDTSVPKLRLDEIELPFKESYDRVGYMTLPAGYAAKMITAKKED